MNKIYTPVTNIDEIRPLLSKISIFGGFTATQLDEILKLLKTVKYDDGEFIYKRGELLSYIYIVKQGEVKITIEEKDIYVDLITFKKGDCFGETSVIGIQSHSLNASAVGMTELIVLEPAKLLNIFETDKEVFGLLILNIARETARRLHQSNEALVQNLVIKKSIDRLTKGTMDGIL